MEGWSGQPIDSGSAIGHAVGLVIGFSLGMVSMGQMLSVGREGSLQRTDVDLVLGECFGRYPVGDRILAGDLGGLLVGCGLGTKLSVAGQVLDVDSASTWLVSGVL